MSICMVHFKATHVGLHWLEMLSTFNAKSGHWKGKLSLSSPFYGTQHQADGFLKKTFISRNGSQIHGEVKKVKKQQLGTF